MIAATHRARIRLADGAAEGIASPPRVAAQIADSMQGMGWPPPVVLQSDCPRICFGSLALAPLPGECTADFEPRKSTAFSVKRIVPARARGAHRNPFKVESVGRPPSPANDGQGIVGGRSSLKLLA